jgi:predicted  nucleic acid-binding Zn-ribbon protein
MGSAVLAITESPKEGVVQVHVTNLGITQIIQFASLVLDTVLPTPSKDYLMIKQLDLGISGGATVDSVYYPPGASFHAAVQLFGHLATVDCKIDKALPGMSFAGSLEHFSLGPLTVKGAKGANPEFLMQISKVTQHLYLDGEIDIFGLTASIHLLAELHPVQLQFETTMAFSNLFSFTLAAQLTGSIDSLQDVANVDFTLTATLEQHILDHIMAQVTTQLLSMKHAADESLEKAQKALDGAEKALQAEIDKKEAELNAKKTEWDKKNDEAQASITAANKHKADREKQLQADVDAAKKAFDDEIAALQRDLDAKTQEMSNEIRAAEVHVSSVKAEVDGKVNGAIADLQHKQDDLNRQMGDVDRSFHDAQDRVNRAQGDLDSMRRHLNDVENDLHNCHWWECVGKAAVVAEVEIELHAKELAFDVEHGVLDLAQKAYDGPVCHTLKEAISLAEGVLADARKVADASLDAANKGLEAVNKVQGAIVQGAKDALAGAQRASQHLHLWDIAKQALTDAVEAESALVQAAEGAVLALTKSAEWVAYKAAQGALEVARAGTHEINVAKAGLQLVEKDIDAVADAGMWLVSHAGDVFNITKITLEGSLHAATKDVKLQATIVGKFANKDMTFSIQYTPGDAVRFVKDAFEAVWTEVKKDVKGFFGD